MTVRTGTAVLALLFALLVGPALLSGGGGTSEAHDQDQVHAPLIDRIAETWPAIDDPSGAAMWPGYHWILAPVRMTGAGWPTVRSVSALFSFALLLVVFRTACRWAPPGTALLLT
ncbi:MAG: hypothetical protein HKN12_04720, partial [Gemmatimonadetes bacterium]|nr:hypothetical protein [Gemmatimonadota bacterium]